MSRLAAVNAIALVIQQLVVVLVSFFITPLLVASVGVAAYGVWQLIVKWSAYLAFLDGRAHENLKWLVARSMSETDQFRREALSASLRVWLCYLPLFLAGSCLLVFAIGNFGSEGDVSASMIMVAAAIMCVNAFLVGARGFPEGILIGSNLAYRSVLLRVVVLIASGIASYVVVYRGYGLTGLALVQLATTAVLAAMYLFLARRLLPWFGLSRPGKPLVNRLRQTGFWFFMWSLVNFALLQMEVLMLGMFAGPELVGKFAITFFAIQMVIVMVETVISGVLPGIGSLLGEEQRDRVRRIHEEGKLYTWWLSISLACGVVLVNRSFVGLWVGDHTFAGAMESLLIVFLALQLVVLKRDSLLINLALEQKKKVQVTAIGIFIVFLLGMLLVPEYGIVGVCLAGILGRMILMVMYPRIIRSFLGFSASRYIQPRSAIVSALLIVGSFGLAQIMSFETWLQAITAGASASILSFALFFVVAMSREQRTMVFSRAKAVIGSKGSD